jgi:hypothetical protein
MQYLKHNFCEYCYGQMNQNFGIKLDYFGNEMKKAFFIECVTEIFFIILKAIFY